MSADRALSALRLRFAVGLVWLGASLLAAKAADEPRTLLLQSTTSTANSGLYDHLLPLFEDDTGIRVNVVAVGTGQALRNASNCDGDVLIVHAKASEEEFVAAGYGTARHDLMHNDFVLIGPSADPARLGGVTTAAGALQAIADSQSPFLSRGDDSGTHKKEVALWETAGVDPSPASGTWYREVGAGMGTTINIAVGMDAYTLTDRATWITHQNRGDHLIVLQGDPALFNQYGVIAVSPEHCPNTNADDAAIFVDWLLSPRGQQAIADYRLNGQPLFVPDVGPAATVDGDAG